MGDVPSTPEIDHEKKNIFQYYDPAGDVLRINFGLRANAATPQKLTNILDHLQMYFAIVPNDKASRKQCYGIYTWPGHYCSHGEILSRKTSAGRIDHLKMW